MLAIELYNKGIRVNSVVPSNIKTEIFNSIVQYINESEMKASISNQPLGLGEPIDIANAVAFLLSSTGTALIVDGRYLVQ